VRLRLDISYDGTNFCGWARQPGLRSVQGEVESALRSALRIDRAIPVRVAVAGRTDAGVHALGQVCHADVPAAAWSASAGPAGTDLTGNGPSPVDVVRRRCNGLLPRDIRVRAIEVAPPGFDARWSASWRRYLYCVADRPSAQDPMTRGHVLWRPRELDVPAMNAAAAAFLGEHDFTAYCRARSGASSVRTVHEIRWVRPGPPDSGDDMPAEGPRPARPAADLPVEFWIRADAFCHSMVRSLVGVHLAVGEGRWPVQRPAELLEAGVRVPSIEAAPAHGLTLVEVAYPAAAGLSAQAERARRYRGH
jgi:tRNA pseudouridine38-40 synthase